jgi:hypothetical protein
VVVVVVELVLAVMVMGLLCMAELPLHHTRTRCASRDNQPVRNGSTVLDLALVRVR